MGLYKDKISFDRSAPADYDQIGAHLMGSSNNLITSTTVSADEGLDVYLLNTSIVVTATDLDIRDLSHTTDSIALGDGTDLLAINADGSINITDNGSTISIDDGAGSITVDGTVAATQSGAWTVGVSGISDGADSLDINADGSINITDNGSSLTIDDGGSSITVDGSVTVSATDLDIRDLTHVSDSVSIGDGTDLLGVYNVGDAISAATGLVMFAEDQSGNADTLLLDANQKLLVNAEVNGNVADDAADSGNPLKVGSRAVDGLLAAISASNDRADLLSDMYRRIWVNNAPNIGVNYEDADVTNTAGELVSTPLAGRTRILIQNLGDKDIFVGNDASITTANGIRVAKNVMLELPFGEDLNVFAIAESGTQDVRIMELA